MENKRGFNRFVNVERFEAFLRDNMRSDYFDLDACLDELADDHGNTGSAEYELGSSFTKSRRPECCSYDVEYIMDGDDVDEVVYTF